MLGAERLQPHDPALERRCGPRLHGGREYTRGVPIYEYACMECESHFEELVRSSDQAVTCPECGAAKVLKQLSSFAVHGASSKPAFSGPAGGGAAVAAARAAAARRRFAPTAASGRGRRLALAWMTVERAAALREYAEQTATCTKCALAQGRTQVVFGSGSPNADLMFVGEAPGFHEDQQGVPFVGQAGKLLDQLLGGIGLTRADVFVANVLKCRPPGNRDPLPEEIAACEPHLFRQIELIEPKLVATLGNFATKLLSGKPAGITRVHGYEQEVTLGARTVLLYPLYHPAAALYTPSMLKVLEEDFARIPGILERICRGARGGDRVDGSGRRAGSRVGTARPLLTCPGSFGLASASAGETERIAAALAGRLAPGDVVTVAGELGSGKTTFVTRRLPCARRVVAGDEPDLHDRAPLRGRGPRLSPRPLPVRLGVAGRVGRSRAVLRRRGRLRRVAAGGSRACFRLRGSKSTLQHAGADRRRITLSSAETALLEGIP